MTSSSVVIGELHNFGFMPSGGNQTFYCEGSVGIPKRQRVRNDHIVVFVKDPKKPIQEYSGVYSWSRSNTLPYSFDPSAKPLFWHLWARFDGRLLRQKASGEVFDKPFEPLANLAGETFVLCPRAPAHEALRKEFMIIKHKEILAKIDEKIKKKEATLLDLEQEKVEHLARLAELEK